MDALDTDTKVLMAWWTCSFAAFIAAADCLWVPKNDAMPKTCETGNITWHLALGSRRCLHRAHRCHGDH